MLPADPSLGHNFYLRPCLPRVSRSHPQTAAQRIRAATGNCRVEGLCPSLRKGILAEILVLERTGDTQDSVSKIPIITGAQQSIDFPPIRTAVSAAIQAGKRHMPANVIGVVATARHHIHVKSPSGKGAIQPKASRVHIDTGVAVEISSRPGIP